MLPAVKNLFEPLNFRNGSSAKNRLVLAAMTNQQSHADGSLSDAEYHWLAVRAQGGFGVVTTCAAHVTKDGQGWPGELGIFSDELLPGLTRLATGLRAYGALPLVQIFHGGIRADRNASGETPIGPSATETARAASEADLERIIEQFANAAARAEQAGMGGVEIHGAHGYLLTQFLSTVNNRRNDAWGGSLENRARLLLRVTEAVRRRVSASFVVGVRISPENFGNAVGLDLDESLQVAQWLSDAGIDFLHVSLWRAFENTQKRPAEHALAALRAVVPADLPLLVAGKIWTRDEADTLLGLGADGVALARSAICNPDWPLRAQDPAWQPSRPPLSEQELRDRGLSETFVQYMRNWKDFVRD